MTSRMALHQNSMWERSLTSTPECAPQPVVLWVEFGVGDASHSSFFVQSSSRIQSLIATGTKLWLDSVDPDFVRSNRALCATGATSNAIIIADVMELVRFDDRLGRLLAERGLTDEGVVWQLTDARASTASSSQ